MRGHLHTIFPSLRHSWLPRVAPPSQAWSAVLEDPRVGPVRLSGRFARVDGARTGLVVVHGLGGSPESHYCVRAAQVAHALGVSCLRPALRGADRSGEDYYHAGLVEDLIAAIESPELAEVEQVIVLGYSLGGHVALRLMLDPPEKVRAVATVCAPLDLSAGATALDAPINRPYLRHVLEGLREIYGAVARRGRAVPVPMAVADKIDRIREWDRTIVAPRHGFLGAEDYYARISVGPHLGALKRPALLISSDQDPMVPLPTLVDALASVGPGVEVRRLRSGGHVSFPAKEEVESVALRWLLERV